MPPLEPPHVINEALESALGDIIASKDAEWSRALRLMEARTGQAQAESLAVIAEQRQTMAEMREQMAEITAHDQYTRAPETFGDDGGSE